MCGKIMVQMNIFKSKLFSYAKYLVGWPLSILAIFFIIRLVLARKNVISSELNNVNIQLLIVGISFNVLFFFLRSFLWKSILAKNGHNIPFKEASFLWGFAELNRYVPGNIWSILSRMLIFSKRNIGKRFIASSLLTEAQLIIVGASLLSIFSFPIIISVSKKLTISLISIFVFLIAFVFIFQRPIANKLFLLYKKFSFMPQLFKGAGFILPTLAPHEISKLLVISIFSYFFYGLGMFFTVFSVLSLSLELIIPLVSFFIFSYLIGYISFITPMGLGVREGVMTLGMAKYSPLAVAGFAAIFARIIFIISEIIFLILSFIWKSTSKNPSQ